MAVPDNSTPGRRCPRCGAELPVGVPSEQCPRCLLAAGLGPQASASSGGTMVVHETAGSARGLPHLGEQMGSYKMVRLLGTGGMGAVYEAEDQQTGRRVALKVLSQTLDSPEARERFFREGRLAAALNHPNSVYVFGTEEIAGTPVISMELVAAGTLQDRVRLKGPMPASEAVDAVLQLVAGLEAAQRIGILHRDIKPSNCFCAEDGTVKIGDFGLSISTGVRTEPALTATGAFLGTPAFCSPEQLRGEELNARSDLYAVGATLFYLLTGRTPFEAANVVALLATVLERRAPSPRKLRPSVPAGLARVVLRCLEKVPTERYKSYEELRQALAPYSSTAPTPATLGLRLVASVLDTFLLGVAGTLAFLPVLGSPLNFLNLATQFSPKVVAWMLFWFVLSVLYYAILEGRYGATPGKLLCRLRVAGPDNNPPGFWRALPRPLIYIILPALPYWLLYAPQPKAYFEASPFTQAVVGSSCYGIIALLFSTARRRNGFAAIHDLLTHTRVISRVALQSRPLLCADEPPPSTVEKTPLLGPYHLLQSLEPSAAGVWSLGYDLRLLRKVWIHTVPPGTPPVAQSLRNLGRVGRLRWLTGKRSSDENWDAYEAVSGTALLRLAHERQPWHQVRYWLYDLATEMTAAETDGSLPVLALDRVWVTADGRAKLLDFPAPGLQAPDSASPAAFSSPPLFLAAVANAALEGRSGAQAEAAGSPAAVLPWHAREFLTSLPRQAGARAVAGALQPLLQRVAAVSRWRRSALVAGCMAFPLFALVGMLFGATVLRQIARNSPGLMELNQLLQERWSLHLFARKAPVPTDREFAIYIASHYRSLITNNAAWSSGFALSMISGKSRRFAEQSLVEHPDPTPDEISEAAKALKPFLPQPEGFDLAKHPALFSGVIAGTLVLYVCLPALAAALLFRGGLVLLIAGVTFVRPDGARASRGRIFWRSLLAWSPLLLAVLLFGVLRSPLGPLWASLPAWLLLAALTAWSLALPARGLQDRLAGTWPVPK